MPLDDIFEELKKQADGRRRAGQPPNGNGHAGTLLISVESGFRHKAADDGLAALHAAGVQFYQRDRSLVRVCLIKAKSTSGDVIFVPGVVPVTPAMLSRELGRSAQWEKASSRGKAPLRIDPPREVVEQILAMIGEWPFPPLAGVIGCPTLRPDGSLLANEGYDFATGLVLHNSTPMPAVSECPTPEDANRAISFLDGLLTEFPFATKPSKSVALSSLITPVVRGAMPAAPLHLATAPQAGTGKSYLADVASAISTGERCAAISVSKNPEETEKRLIGAALAGYPLITLDNCRDLLEGDFLCQVTERPLLQLRRLGSSDQLRVANTFVVFGNGNNATVADDLVRRTIICALDANMEKPETRTFDANPLAMIRRNRGSYIAAALTVARAYLAAGKTGRLPPLESYEAWSDLVRSPLVWLGYSDPVDTMEAGRGADPVRETRAAIFQAWLDEIGTEQQLMAAEIVEYAAGLYGSNGKPARPKLNAALLDAFPMRGAPTQIDPRRLGVWLRKNENTIVAGTKLVVDRGDAQRPRWRLKFLD